MAKPEIHNADTIRQLLNYDYITGLLVWLERGPEWFSGGAHGGAKASALMWNKKFSGKPALTTKGRLGYLSGSLFNQKLYAHRAAWLIANGDIPEGMVVDHINGDPSDNRLSNLRVVARKLNQRNLGLKRPYLEGVSKHGAKWRVVLAYQRIGSFDTKQEALEASRSARREMGFSVRHGELNVG